MADFDYHESLRLAEEDRHTQVMLNFIEWLGMNGHGICDYTVETIDDEDMKTELTKESPESLVSKFLEATRE